MRRRPIIVLTLLCALALPSGARAASFTTSDYWDFADAISAALDTQWGSRSESYRTGNNLRDTRLNSAMLLVHAAAAITGHEGPSRDDGRVLTLARKLVSPPAFVLPGTKLPRAAQSHAPGWNSVISDRVRNQHVSIDARVAQALAIAWRAGPIVGMSQNLSDLIRDRIAIVARSRFFRTPRLNQINWAADLAIARATVTGSRVPLRRTIRSLILGFTRHARTPARPGWAPNLNAGYGLVYAPPVGADAPVNRVAPSEYENLVISALGAIPRARRAGMRRLPRSVAHTLRLWQARTLFGDWTHSGYLNWDTGLGLARWHLVRYWAHAQSGLLALATGTGVAFDRREAAWAKSILDASLELYDRWADPVTGTIRTSHPWHLKAPTQHDGSDPQQTASRFAATAAQAALTGLGERTGAVPPPYYALDPRPGRLAVSTPSYSTAIVRAAPGGYGGGELARLIGRDGGALANIGGHAAAAFGLRVRAGRHTLLETQPGRSAPPLGISAPQLGSRRPRGTFSTLRARVDAIGRGVRARTQYAFSSRSIAVHRTITSATGRRRATLRFPSWGSRAAISLIVGGAAPVALARGARIVVERGTEIVLDGREGSYRVRLTRVPAGAVISQRRPHRQASAPDPGPTVTVTFPLRKGRTTAAYVIAT